MCESTTCEKHSKNIFVYTKQILINLLWKFTLLSIRKFEQFSSRKQPSWQLYPTMPSSVFVFVPLPQTTTKFRCKNSLHQAVLPASEPNARYHDDDAHLWLWWCVSFMIMPLYVVHHPDVSVQLWPSAATGCLSSSSSCLALLLRHLRAQGQPQLVILPLALLFPQRLVLVPSAAALDPSCAVHPRELWPLAGQSHQPWCKLMYPVLQKFNDS